MQPEVMIPSDAFYQQEQQMMDGQQMMRFPRMPL